MPHKREAASYVQKWLEELGGLLLQVDPALLPDPLRITNSNFAEQFIQVKAETKKLIALLESHTLSELPLKMFNAAYQWFNFCIEIYDACIQDLETMALQPEFLCLENALHAETQNAAVGGFFHDVWNRLMPNSSMSYAQCYAILCQTIGPDTTCTRNFIYDIAGNLTDQVTPAVNYEYRMSHYPSQMDAFLHHHAVSHYYQKYWYDKGHDPQLLKDQIYKLQF